MSKSFSQAPKPPPLTAEVITAFERSGTGQDTRGRVPLIVGKRENPNVGRMVGRKDDNQVIENAHSLEDTNVGIRARTDVEMGRPTNVEPGVTTKPAKGEPTRRLSIDLPESWHRRFKIACTRADKKMIDEVTEFIKRRTLELEIE
jgi:hypothetical protein